MKTAAPVAPSELETIADPGLEARIEDTLVAAEALLDEADHDAPRRSAPAEVGVSVVIPVFNERETIAEIIERVEALPLDKELIIVDDCSTDGTREILECLAAIDGKLRLFVHDVNQGKGAALRTGFAQARGEIVVVQDADLEYDPRDIPKVLSPILAGEADVVYGSRFLAGKANDPSLVHRLGNRLLTAASNFCTGQHLTDMETCYKAFHRHVLPSLNITQNRFGVEPELTAQVAAARFRIQEVPISYHGRGYSAGKKIGWRDAVSTLWCIARYGLRG
ncbi:MAG: glycosyltransferase family 2 protein [Pirellulales bacterium]